MSVDIPTTLQGFVNDELSAGKFANESELVAAALETFLEMKRRHLNLKERVTQSLRQRDQGLASSVDFKAVKDQIRDAARRNA
ncbi:MAG: hypothetical protein AAFN77_03065 [Planctomycetota bacterium]